MKKLLYLFILFGLFLLSSAYAQIPGTPNASGVIQPGPPWATGTNTGAGELEGHLGYINDKANINSTQLQDSLGTRFNILDYGAVADSLPSSATVNTAAIKAAIAAAGRGTVTAPSGSFYINDSIRIDDFTKIVGAGMIGSNGTNIIQTVNKPAFVFQGNGNDFYTFGGSISDLRIQGGYDGDSALQHGIMYRGLGSCNVNNILIYRMGGHGIMIDTVEHAGSLTVQDCIIKQCLLDGIYGRHLPNDDAQLNRINIINNNINDMRRHGINIVGQFINILRNNIQHCDSTGILLSARDVGAQNCSSLGMNIFFNEFEANKGGEIFGEIYADGSITQYHKNLAIAWNGFVEDGGYDKPGADAIITLRRASGSNEVYGFTDLHLGPNVYEDATVAHVDGNEHLEANAYVWISSTAATPSVDYLGLGRASTSRNSNFASGRKFVSGITAIGGVTEANLAGFMDVYLSAPIDITADPQIAAGRSGQIIIIKNNDGTNTLTLDDGTGLVLNSQYILGEDDIITLMYTEQDNAWIELSRSDN